MYLDILRELFSMFSGGVDIFIILLNPPNVITLDKQTSIIIVKVAMTIIGIIVGLVLAENSILFSKGANFSIVVLVALIGIISIPDDWCIMFVKPYLGLAKILEGVMFGLGASTMIKKYKFTPAVGTIITLALLIVFRREISAFAATIAGYIVVSLVAGIGLINTTNKLAKADKLDSFSRGALTGFWVMAMAGLIIAPGFEEPEKTILSLIFPVFALVGLLAGLKRWRFLY